jgi:hypothetical protein
MHKTKRKRGKRGGSDKRLKDIHSKLDGRPTGTHSNHAHNLHGNSTANLVIDAAKYFECATIEENRQDHVIPRQSITRKQLLQIFPQRVETEPVPTKQLDRRSGNMVETTDNRVTWKSDRTLLRKGKPFDKIGVFKREGSISVGLNTRKLRRTENEDKQHTAPVYENTPDGIKEAVDERDILGPAIDEDLF